MLILTHKNSITTNLIIKYLKNKKFSLTKKKCNKPKKKKNPIIKFSFKKMTPLGDIKKV